MSIPFTWIYLIYDPYTGLHKIGRSDNPRGRHKTLTKPPSTILAAPNDYEFIEAWLAPESMEGELHRRYAGQRSHGEWFKLTEDKINDIKMVFAGNQRLSTGDTLEYANEADLAHRWFSEYCEAKKEIDKLELQLAGRSMACAMNADNLDYVVEGFELNIL